MLKLTLSFAVKNKERKKSFYINITYKKEEGICYDDALQDSLRDAGKDERRMCLLSSLPSLLHVCLEFFCFFNQTPKMEPSLPLSFVLTDF